MKSELQYVKAGMAKPLYQMEQSASMQYWKERYLWLLERYNQVLEKSIRTTYRKEYINHELISGQKLRERITL